MKTKTLAVSACLLAVGLSACGRHERWRENAALCPDFAQASTAATPAANDAAAPVDECVKRWAYSLAPSRDDAAVVASAAVAACGTLLSRWNQQAIAQAPADAAVQPLSLTTGEPTNPLAEHNSFAQNRALLYVVQARAGRCRPPPAVNGVPQGIPG